MIDNTFILFRKKVAFVTPILGTKDSFLYMKPLLSSLASRCGSFRVFVPDQIQHKNLLDFDVESSGRVIRFGWHAGKGEEEHYPEELRFISPALVKHLWAYSPDLIVLNDFSLLSFFIAGLRPLFSKAKILLLVETKQPPKPKTTLLSRCRLLHRTLVARTVDTILTNNSDGKLYLTANLGARPEKVMVSPYLCSDMASLANMTSEEIRAIRLARDLHQPVRFLYVGQVIPQKGLQYLIAALTTLLPQYTGKFTLDIVGDGPFREQLQTQVQEAGLSAWVTFHGRQPYSSLWRWYLQGDVFLYPTLSDYRALAPFEALSMGLPILGSIYDGGSNEVIAPSQNGYICDPRDVQSLADVLSQFIKAPERITAFGLASLSLASAYTLERAVQSLVVACTQTLALGSEAVIRKAPTEEAGT